MQLPTPLFLLLATAAGCVTPDPRTLSVPATREHVQRDVETLLTALYAGDADTLLRFTHPLILERLGGLERAKPALAEIARQLQTKKLRVESLSFPSPPDLLDAKGRRFAIVPTLTVITAEGKRRESLNYQIGVLDAGASSWKYVAGSSYDATNVRSLFPDFPADYQFPKFYRKQL